MSKKRRQAHPIPAAEPTSLLAGGVTITALFTVLAFQGLRFEAYEAEKAGLVWVAGAVLAPLLAYQALAPGPRQVFPWRQVVRSPIVLAAGLVLLSGLVATVLSLSIERSLWGGAPRSQGFITLLACLILFFAAALNARLVLPALIPSLVLLALPMGLYALIEVAGLDQFAAAVGRPGSTAGNPNFLSSWLVIALLLVLPHAADHYDRTRSRKYLLFYGGWAIFVAAILLITRSRGALLGLIAGGLLWALIRQVTGRRTRAALGLLLVTLMLGLGLILAGWFASQLGDSGGEALSRLVVPFDELRVTLWRDMLGIIQQQTVPLVAADGQPDRWAALRPVVGYGLDTSDYLYGRLPRSSTSVLGEGVFIDRAHNLVWDDLLSAGWFGLIASLTLYAAVVRAALVRLRLLAPGDGWKLILFVAVGASGGAALIAWMLPAIAWPVLLPVSATGGAFAGLLAWIGYRVLSGFGTPEELPLVPDRQPLVVGVLCATVAQWIDLQFGFAHLVTQPLWWILVGVLVGSHPAGQPAPDPDSREWHLAVFSAGLFTLHSLGLAIRSQYVSQQAASWYSVFAISFLIALLGLIGAWLHSSGQRLGWRMIGIVIGVWLIYYPAKLLAGGLAASAFNRAFALPDVYAAPIWREAAGWLAVSGILAFVLSAAAWSALQGSSRWPRGGTRGVLVVVLAGLLVGGSAYSLSYRAAVLRKIATSLLGLGDLAAVQLAGEARAAAQIDLWPAADLRVLEIDILIARVVVTPLDQREPLARQRDDRIRALLQQEPYFIHTRAWLELNRRLAAVAGP